jgi:hypothetical protein
MIKGGVNSCKLNLYALYAVQVDPSFLFDYFAANKNYFVRNAARD